MVSPDPQSERVVVPVFTAPPPVQYPTPRPQVPTRGWPPPGQVHSNQAQAQAQAQIQAFMAQEHERARQNNEMLMNWPRPGEGRTLQMQHIAYPQATMGPGLAHQAAEQRYLEARADFLNTKDSPTGPIRYTPESVQGMVGSQSAMFNPVLQKAQQAEVLRQQRVNTP